jgi:Cu2+-exporting ATPase
MLRWQCPQRRGCTCGSCAADEASRAGLSAEARSAGQIQRIVLRLSCVGASNGGTARPWWRDLMKTSIVEVREMLSVLSVLGVEKRIREVPGVESATVDFAAATATIRYDETRLNVADIKSDIRQSGYEPAAPVAISRRDDHKLHAAPDEGHATPTSAAPQPAAHVASAEAASAPTAGAAQPVKAATAGGAQPDKKDPGGVASAQATGAPRPSPAMETPPAASKTAPHTAAGA